MFDPYNTFNRQPYADEVIEDAKANPHVGVSMLVSVYAPDSFELLGEGVVQTMRWSEFFCQYLCTVQTKYAEYTILAGCLRRRINNRVSLEIVA